MSATLLAVNGAAVNSSSFTVSAGTSRMAIASYHLESSTVPTSVSATLGGTAITALGSIDSSSGIESTYVFFINEATLTTIGTGAKTLVFTETGGAGFQGKSSGLIQYDGAAQTTPLFNTNFSAGDSSPSAAVTFLAAGGAIAGFLTQNNIGVTTADNGSGVTIDYDAASGTADNRAVVCHKLGASSGSQSVSLTIGASTQYALLVVGVEASGAAASPTLPQLERFSRGVTRGVYQR